MSNKISLGSIFMEKEIVQTKRQLNSKGCTRRGCDKAAMTSDQPRGRRTWRNVERKTTGTVDSRRGAGWRCSEAVVACHVLFRGVRNWGREANKTENGGISTVYGVAGRRRRCSSANRSDSRRQISVSIWINKRGSNSCAKYHFTHWIALVSS